jgi:DNA-binding NarL/FixJ family response regulator
MTGVSKTQDQYGREGAEPCGKDDPGRCPGSPGRREYPGLTSAHSPNGTLRSVAQTDLITIVVADDQRLIRDGIRVILDHEPGMRVVGEASDGLEAVGVVARLRPRVVLMDIQMPVLDGLEAARRILQASRVTSVLMLTTFDDDEYIYRALQCGASGFLLKDSPQSQLIEAVRAIAAGGALIDPLTTRRLIGRFASAVRPARAVPSILSELTGRELDVLRLVAEGLSNAEIAERLVVEESTVKTHIGHILTKLNLRDRVQAVVLAYETGFVRAEP